MMVKKSLITGLVLLTALPLFAVKGTLRTEADSKSGDIKWQPRAKKYTVTFKKGSTTVNAEYPLADVVELSIPKPEGFDKAAEQVAAGHGAGAIATLEKILSEYRMLQWDKPAGRYLAMAYISAGQAQKAYDTCRSIIADDKSAAWSGDLAAAYWQSLLKLGKTDQLENVLKKAATSGDRQAAAAVCVMRGDVILSEGSSPEILKRALRDGYLKASLMFTDPACSRERAEAMLKAADCFEKLGQASRADKLRTKARAL